MGQIIGIVLALLVGWVTWGLSAAMANGVYPLGSAGRLEALIFYAPIVGLAAPAALRAFLSGAIVLGVWILSLAPVLGVVNFLLFVGVVAGPSQASMDHWQSATILAGLWQVPLVASLVTMFLGSRRLSGQSNLQAAASTGEDAWVLASSSSGVEGPYIKVLRDRGYEVRSRRAHEWRIERPGSMVLQYVRSTDELKSLALAAENNDVT